MSRSFVTFQIGATPPPRLDKALARDVPADANLSRTRLARMLAAGDVMVNGRVETNPKAKVQEGAEISITLEIAEVDHLLPEDIPLDVIFEDADLIVVNKPAGMVVHPAPGSPSGTLVNALMAHCGAALSGVGGEKRPGIVHRIDKDTSGLLVVAKSDQAHHGLAAQFEDHSVERRYDAFCYGVPNAADPRLRGIKGVSFEEGGVVKITSHLARHKTDRQRQAVIFDGGRHAVTRFKVMQSFGDPAVVSRIACWLETGRTHQIRAHLAHVGHGLIGDPTYGGRRRISAKAIGDTGSDAIGGFSRQALHAAVLGFIHPVSGEELRFEAPMPEDLERLQAALSL
jgi:23S rRNA pseudouridine1911/1915/1917 synthase